MKKYTTDPEKVHLNSVMETTRNRSFMKNIRQIQSFQKNNGTRNEKLFIIEHPGNNLLNQRNELISKCRHKNKFKLMNYKA